MRSFTHSALCSMLAAALAQAAPALAQDAELDALNLQSAPEAAPETAAGAKFFVEAAVGNASQRYQSSSRDIGRVSLDFSHSARLAPGWRAVLSDRLDYIHPADQGADATVNSLREAYLSWQPEGGSTAVEFGRINLRYGPGYGYYRPAYYGGYAPAYYGGYGYDPYPWGGYTTTYYSTGYAPAYYGYRYRRVVRPAYAYYGTPFPRRHFHHHRWHHRW